MQYGNWEPLQPKLGEGGQSTVYLARTPERVQKRRESAAALRKMSGIRLDDIRAAEEFSKAVVDLSRQDLSTEVGALKVFRIRTGGAPAQERLKREIQILSENRRNLPRLLDSNEKDQWIVTEYFANRTLFESPTRYQGEALAALKAFKTLVQTVATSLHADHIVHRDIKPANIFIGNDGSLIPGDFGIVFLPTTPCGQPSWVKRSAHPITCRRGRTVLTKRWKKLNPTLMYTCWVSFSGA